MVNKKIETSAELYVKCNILSVTDYKMIKTAEYIVAKFIEQNPTEVKNLPYGAETIDIIYERQQLRNAINSIKLELSKKEE